MHLNEKEKNNYELLTKLNTAVQTLRSMLLIFPVPGGKCKCLVRNSYTRGRER
jgi:hypothetical protein